MITENDVRLYASERMSDFADGGGRMSTVVIVDGLDNNVFPDVTDIDRLTGRLSIRKLFGAVVSLDSDTYLSAHAMLDDVADDPATTSAMFTGGTFTTVNSGVSGILSGGHRHYGVARAATGLSIGDSSIDVGNTSVQIIPPSVVITDPGSTTVTPGETVTSTTTGILLSTSGIGYIPVGVTVPLIVNLDTIAPAEMAIGKIDAGSISGTVTMNGSSVNITRSNGGNTLTIGSRTYVRTQRGFDNWVHTGVSNPDTITASSVVGTVCLPVNYVRESQVVPTTGGLTYSVSLLPDVVLGSAYINHTSYITYPILASDGFQNEYNLSQVTINRSTGGLGLVFSAWQAYLRIDYLRKTNFEVMVSPASTTLDSNGAGTFSLTSGFEFASAEFKINGELAVMQFGLIKLYPSMSVLGEISKSGVVSMPTRPGAVCTELRGVQQRIARSATNFTFDAGKNLVAGSPILTGKMLNGDDFTAASTASGNDSVFSTTLVSGVYKRASGELSLTFSQVVSADAMYVSSTTSYTNPGTTVVVPPTSVTILPTMVLPVGIVRGNYPAPVVIFANGDSLLIHSTLSLSANVSNGSTTNTRTSLARLRVIGNSGVEHARFTKGVPAPSGVGCTADLAAGTVTFQDVSGMSQPVTVEHRIEEMAMAVSVGSGVITLNRALGRAFPANTKVSSLCMLGDLQGRVTGGFAQSAWTGAFEDSVLGGTPTADFNEPVYPIVTSNKGAITDRWAFIFTGTTTFRCIGELTGEIAGGNTGLAYEPINPATSAPYFTAPALGWGSGWAAGNVYRKNTIGAQAPLWILRAIAPSVGTTGTDSITAEFRGYVNA